MSNDYSTMKGSVSYWIWIVGGILAGIIIFGIAYSQLLGASQKISEERTIERFSSLKTKINDLCWASTGSEEEFEIKLADTVEGIYLDNDTEGKVNRLGKKVLEVNISEGNYLCLKIEKSNPRCVGLDCNASMPYIGRLKPKSSIRSFLTKITGERTRYTFGLQLNKTGGNVTITRSYP